MGDYIVKRYVAGTITEDGDWDFYWDTRFESFEEAAEWGINHGCTHVYDDIADTTERIDGKEG